LDRVRGAGDVGPAFYVGERWGDQDQQEPDDADDDEQFEQRKTPNAFGVTLLGQSECSAGALTLQWSVIT